MSEPQGTAPVHFNSPFTPPSVQEMDIALGDAFDVESIIGIGGMAVVYKGYDRSDANRPIAIKVLPEEVAAKDVSQSGFDYTNRFVRESQAMACLDHPNIVKVYHCGETAGGLHFFTMEYIEGHNLYNLIKSADITHDHIYSWLIQICDGLTHAHEAGFIHRDVKPGNILVASDGCVKIADFGLVKVNNRELMESMDTVIAMGTPDFSAPEIVDRREKGDCRCDIYSVGIMAYQLFTGMLPKGLWEPPSKLVEGLDRRLDRIIDSALHNNEEKRYQSISIMRDELKSIAPERVTGLPKVQVPSGQDPFVPEAIRMHYFPEMSSEDFQELIAISKTCSVLPGEAVLKKDYANQELIFLAAGRFTVVGDDRKKIADLGAGSFVGEMSYLTGYRPSATVVATIRSHYLVWEFDKLKDLCGRNDKIQASINAKISADLVEKLTPKVS